MTSVKRIPEDMQEGTLHLTKHNGELRVITYTSNLDVLVEFTKTKTRLTVSSTRIRKGILKDPYFPRVVGVGYLGEFSKPVRGKNTSPLDRKIYEVWADMLIRCYCPKFLSKYPTYTGCVVDPKWHNFNNFYLWAKDKYVAGSHLDKDGLSGEVKKYSPTNCQFISPQHNAELALSKRYVVTHPCGKEEEVFNLSKFTQKHGLNHTHLHSVARGAEGRKQHKGYTARSIR